ncbi:MAG: replication restart helicase PriA, partial [Thermodesulfobacteriota bacterium]
MHWNAALLTPPYSTLTYAVPDYLSDQEWRPCHRVCVPLGKSWRPGMLLTPCEKQESSYSIKPFFWPLEENPLINPDYLDLIFDLGKRQLKTPGEILASILPAGLRSLNLTLHIQHPEFPRPVKFRQLFQLENERFELLLELWKGGKAHFVQNSSGKEEYICIAKNPPWNLRPRAHKQIELMNHLWKSGTTRKTEILKEFGSHCSQVLKSLENKGLISTREEFYSSKSDTGELEQASLQDFTLSSEQEEVYNSLLKDMQAFSGKVGLLHGVTGSGKTLIYLLLARQCLSMGRSVLILAPEVALALQLWKQAEKYLQGNTCILYHGYQSRSQREESFQRVAGQQDPCIVIGTRSAVFLPRIDWGLIVVDEEHDSSFKQEERFQYQAKEVAFFLARQYKGMLLMGSATPDIKTFYSAVNQYFPLLRLNSRVGESCLPQVDLVNLHQEPQVEGSFSTRARDEMLSCLSRGEQAILLLNRRGYSPLVYCTDCGNVINCSYCQVGMTYHKNLG